MIRTKIVEISAIEAVAYRQKLKGGKTGLVIMKFGLSQPGMAIMDRTTGRPVVPANAPKAIPYEAYAEAARLTDGLTYARHHKFQMLGGQRSQVENVEVFDEEPEEELVVVSSEDYNKIVNSYKDKNGDFSYLLINRDFLKFAKSSSLVSNMVNNKASVDEIRKHIIRSRFETITGNHKITDREIDKIVEMLDEVHKQGVFKKLNAEIKKLQR